MGTVIFSEEVDNTLANDVPDDNCSNSISTDETNELLQMIDKLSKKVNELELKLGEPKTSEEACPLEQLEERSHHPHPDNNSQDLKTLFNDSVEEDEYVDQKRQSLRLLEKKARDNMFKYKEKYASKETSKPLEPAQEVYLRNHQLSSAPNNVTASLLPRWHGPYIIQKHLGGGVYQCVHAQNTKDVRKVDQSQMQLYPNDV
ncbi:hypothetical protein M8J76_011059 [Diaphorina citri]|nr:hypothetical protein M8J76_011059 [Diaphorina citri]